MPIKAFIPARKHSKRLPNKSLRLILGKPMLAYTLEAAQAADIFDQIIVTSDDADVLALAEAHGATAHRRDPALAQDTVTLAVVMRHLLAEYPCDSLALLLPTSPLRTAYDLQEAAKLHRQTGDTVMSVMPYTHPPQHAVFEQGGLLQPWRPDDMAQQSQRMTGMLYHDGSFIFCRTADFTGDWYAGRVRPYFVRGVDVNTAEDLAAAEVLMVAGRYLRGIEPE